MMTSRKLVIVRDVWKHNLHSEFQIISAILPWYSVISMDTEFPGTISKPKVENYLISQMNPLDAYELMKKNVDALKIIQLGLTLSDVNGNLPGDDTNSCYVWQFNFSDFDLDRDLYDRDSIQLLERQGIDFQKNKAMGIDSCEFGRLMMESGMLFRGGLVTWITFQGSFDFGFLIKILTQKELPQNLLMFMTLMTHFFGANNFDMKYIVRHIVGLYGGLESVAKTLEVERIAGKRHQAGSDSLLTLEAFMKMKERFFFTADKIDYLHRLRNILSGIEFVSSSVDIMTALQMVLRTSLAHGGLVRGLHEAAKVIKEHGARLCVLAEDCDKADYVKLIKSLCVDHKVKLIVVPNAKSLGEWAGLCKIDSQGKARKVVGCSCLVVKDYGEETEGLHILQQYVESH